MSCDRGMGNETITYRPKRHLLSCAAGTMQTSAATVALSRPRIQKGERVFARVVITYTDEDGKPQVEREDSLDWTG